MSSQVDAAGFRRACAQWATGIAVVTVTDKSGFPHGMTANSFTSVSLDPPMILVCVDFRAAILPLLEIGTGLAVNVLPEDQADISSRFASRVEDRFENLDWTVSPAGNAVLAGTLAVFEGSVAQMIPAGDHQIVVAQVDRADYREGRPLIYFESGYQTLG